MNMQQQVLGTAPVSLPRACRSQQRKAARHIQPVKAVVMDAPPSDKLQNGHSENQIRNGKVGTMGPTIINGQILHSMTAQQLDAVRSMEDYVEAAVVPNLKDVSKCWQPADYLPDPSSPDFLDEVAELQKRTNLLPDDYFVVLVGDMITEEALPTYMAMLNTLDGVRDETGAADTPWGRWNRAWTAEENRHGDLMNKYCWLSGRVNMKAVEVTIQNLIGSGMDPKTENNPYLGFIYTSFQERATAVSHGATARHALELGDKTLGRICGAIASDEKRHERAYCMIVSELFRRDPSGTILAFADMMKKKIVMPAHMMDDHEHMPKTGRGLFSDFSAVAQSTGTYTAVDYADIMMHLIKLWKIEGLTGLSPEAEAAQDWLCKQPPRIRRLAERDLARTNKPTTNAPFSWIFNREIELVPSKY